MGCRNSYSCFAAIAAMHIKEEQEAEEKRKSLQKVHENYCPELKEEALIVRESSSRLSWAAHAGMNFDRYPIIYLIFALEKEMRVGLSSNGEEKFLDLIASDTHIISQQIAWPSFGPDLCQFQLRACVCMCMSVCVTASFVRCLRHYKRELQLCNHFGKKQMHKS